MTKNDQGSGSQAPFQNPDAIDALLLALGRFQREHPNYVPKLDDGVIWSEDGIRPKMLVFRVTAIARVGNSWNVTIEEVSDKVSDNPRQDPVSHVVPVEHLSRSADVMADMFVQLQRSTPLLSVIMGRPAKPRRIH